MKIRVFLTAAAIAAFGLAPLPAAPSLMPIGERIEAPASKAERPTIPAGNRLALPVTPEHLAAALRSAYARVATFADRPADVQAFGLPASAGSQMGALLRPIATPLVM